MANSRLEQEKLAQDLMQDLTAAEQEVKQADQGRMGSVPAGQSETLFRPKAIRYKNKVMGQAELSNVYQQFDDTLDQILNNEKSLSDLERQQFRVEYQKKFGALQKEMISSAAQFESMLRQRELDEAEMNQLIANFGNSVGTATMIGVSQMGKKQKGPTVTAGEGTVGAPMPTAGATGSMARGGPSAPAGRLR